MPTYLKACSQCREAFEPDDKNTSKCDTCSLGDTPTTEPEFTSLEKRRELDEADQWTRETIKRDWKKAAEVSRLKIIADYNASRKPRPRL